MRVHSITNRSWDCSRSKGTRLKKRTTEAGGVSEKPERQLWDAPQSLTAIIKDTAIIEDISKRTAAKPRRGSSYH